MFRWLAIVVLSTVLTGCGLLPRSSSAFVKELPSALYLVQNDSALPMDRGRYCWITVEDGICTDDLSPYYAIDEHIPVSGQTLDLLVDAPYPDSVDVSLHPGGDMLSEDADISLEATLREGGMIQVTIPEGIEGDFVLVAFPVWENSRIPNGGGVYTFPVRFE